MRGKEKLVGIGDFDEGITPAYAGKSTFDIIPYFIR